MDIKYEPSKYYLMFGLYEPALRLNIGDSVETTTVDAGGKDRYGKPIPPEMLQSSDDTEYYLANPLVGPFYIKGAEIGDALVVQIERITLNRDTTYSKILPNFGSFTDEGPGKRLLFNEPLDEVKYEWNLDLGRKIGIL
ncbi:MAG: hypothetical protein ACUVTL_10615, partial [Thermoproteota archaeon]